MEDRCLRIARPALDWKAIASGDTAAKGGIATFLLLGDSTEAPSYGHVYGKEASRKWVIAYRDYSSLLESCTETGVVRRDQSTTEELMPRLVNLLRSRKYGTEVKISTATSACRQLKSTRVLSSPAKNPQGVWLSS